MKSLLTAIFFSMAVAACGIANSAETSDLRGNAAAFSGIDMGSCGIVTGWPGASKEELAQYFSEQFWPGLVAARNGGTWDGSWGYTSWVVSEAGGEAADLTIGWLANADFADANGMIYETFGGCDLTEDDGARGYFMLKPTWLGDVNLDGEVDMTDLHLVNDHLGMDLRNNRLDAWCFGDMNFDGFVNSRDAKIVHDNLGEGGYPIQWDSPVAVIGWVPPPDWVPPSAPEPSTLAILLTAGVCGISVLGIRRRKKHSAC